MKINLELNFNEVDIDIEKIREDTEGSLRFYRRIKEEITDGKADEAFVVLMHYSALDKIDEVLKRVVEEQFKTPSEFHKAMIKDYDNERTE